jgi:hypothetical protein
MKDNKGELMSMTGGHEFPIASKIKQRQAGKTIHSTLL